MEILRNSVGLERCGAATLFFCCGWRGWRSGSSVFNGVQKLAREIVHASAHVTQPRGKLVVAHKGGNCDDKTSRSRNQRLGDTGSHCPQRRCASSAKAVKRIDDTHHRSKEADERSRCRDGRKPRQAAFHAGARFAGRRLCGTLEALGISGETASARLPLILVCDFSKDGDQWARLELVSDRCNFAQTCGFAKRAQEALALHLSFAKGLPLRDHDRP